MIVLGLTGGIAMGKSHVSRTLRELGARVWDADESARRVVEPGTPGNRALRQVFGPEYFLPDQTLDRAALGRHVFNDPERVERLNAALHPYILEDMRRHLEDWRREGVAVAVVDAPLLFETDIDREVDEVWTVSCPEREQLRRIMYRDGLTREQAQARLSAQMSNRERRSRAHRVIDTAGSMARTRRQVESYYQIILSEAVPCIDSKDGSSLRP